MPQRLTIIGVGLLGGSIGLAVRERIKGCHITGCAHREASLVQAKQIGALDEWTLDPAAAVANADLVVLCMPVGLIPAWMERIADHLKAGAVVTDVGSTKLGICRAGEQIGRGAHFVGSHPMAGGAQKGVAVARADLFEGATCVLTPIQSTDPTALKTVEQFWRNLGMRIVIHDPAKHDQLVALVSHLPHAVAAALVAVQDEASIDIHGKGFFDSTRIAAGDAELWRDIFTDNRENVIAAIDRLTEELGRLSKVLKNNETDALQTWLKQQADRRSQL